MVGKVRRTCICSTFSNLIGFKIYNSYLVRLNEKVRGKKTNRFCKRKNVGRRAVQQEANGVMR
jgi:hypothetical protein